MERRMSRGWIGLLVMGAGCSATGPIAPLAPGNEALGIAEFRVDETADLTTIVGVDAAGYQVARLDLVHGRYVLAADTESPFAGQEVDGRRMTMDVLGQKTKWETIGYSPTLQMPAMPAAHWALGAFVADPHVKPILAQWQIGFKTSAAPAASKNEVAYAQLGDEQYGDSFTGDCTPGGYQASTCPITQGTTNACAGSMGSLMYEGASIHQSWASENVVEFCCSSDFWNGSLGVKTCADSGTSSACGDVGQKCSGACPGFPIAFSNGCEMFILGLTNLAAYDVDGP
jgi:hypothetical protein